MHIDYLITGGAGFIGCSLATALLRPGATPLPAIVAVDNLHSQVHPSRERPTALPGSVDLQVFDVCDGDAWDALLARVRPRAVVHLAAETGTGQSLDLPTRHTHTNVTGTAAMLEAFDRAGHAPEHILLTSSRAVYGEGEWRDPVSGAPVRPGLRSREQLARGEFGFVGASGQAAVPLAHDQQQTRPAPTSVYGATKLAQEHILDAWCAARSTALSVMRLQNVYGVGQSPFNPYTGIIGLFHRIAAQGQAIEVYEDGQIGRDFVAIDDVTAALTLALRHAPAGRRTLDVGSGKAMTVLEAAQTIAGLYDAPAPRISGAFRNGDIRWAVCSPEGLAAELGFRATVDFLPGNLALSNWLHAMGVIDRAARAQSA